jgi:hypothetical protein
MNESRTDFQQTPPQAYEPHEKNSPFMVLCILGFIMDE